MFCTCIVIRKRITQVWHLINPFWLAYYFVFVAIIVYICPYIIRNSFVVAFRFRRISLSSALIKAAFIIAAQNKKANDLFALDDLRKTSIRTEAHTFMMSARFWNVATW